MSKINVNDIITNTDQPRKYFDQNSLKELAASIKKHGLLENLVVRPQNDQKTIPQGKYELVCGERRLKACNLAGVTMVTVSIKDLSDKEAFELSLTENIQRDNLSPIEEAQAYRKLQQFHSQGKISRIVHKGRTRINQMLKLLDLPEEIHPFFNSFCGFEPLTERHGRELLRFKRFLDKVVKGEPVFCHHCTDEYEYLFLKNKSEGYNPEDFRIFYQDYCLSRMVEKDGKKYQVGHKYIKDCLLFDVAQGAFFHKPSFKDFVDDINWFIHNIIMAALLKDRNIAEAKDAAEKLRVFLRKKSKKRVGTDFYQNLVLAAYQKDSPLSGEFSDVKKDIDGRVNFLISQLPVSIQDKIPEIQSVRLLEKYDVDRDGLDGVMVDGLAEWWDGWLQKQGLME